MYRNITPFSDESQAFHFFSETRKTLSQLARICILLRDPELTAHWIQANDAFQELLAAHMRSLLSPVRL